MDHREPLRSLPPLYAISVEHIGPTLLIASPLVHGRERLVTRRTDKAMRETLAGSNPRPEAFRLSRVAARNGLAC